MDENAIGRQKRERQSPRMDALDVRETRQRVRVEREHRAGEHPGGAVPGPLVRNRVAGPRRQREAQKQNEVEDEHRRGPEPVQRGAHQSLDDQGLGKGERVALGIENVAVEEVRGRARELVRDPRQDPLVQLGVGVVVARQRRGIGRERPGVDDGEQEAEAGDRARAVDEPQHGDAGL